VRTMSLSESRSTSMYWGSVAVRGLISLGG
jgi:hypothetical protein